MGPHEKLFAQGFFLDDLQGIAVVVTFANKLLYRELAPRKEEDPLCTNALGWHDPILEKFQKQWDHMQSTF